MKAKTILILVLIGFLLVILLQNWKEFTEEFTFRLFFWKIVVSNMILVPLLLLIGLFIGFLLARTGRRRP